MSLSDYGKKVYTLDLIEESMKLVADSYHFDLAPFSEAARRVRLLDYKNSWKWKKGSKKSPNGKFRTEVIIDHEVDRFDIRVNIASPQGGVFGGTVLSNTLPDEIIIDSFLGELRWLDDDRLVIDSKLKDHPPISFRRSELAYREDSHS